MRFANPHPPRRGAFLLIALFSCLQILFGFFLFTGNKSDSVLQQRSSVQVASIEDALLLNKIETASGTIAQEASLPTNCEQCGTFSYFDEYRKKARQRASARKHDAQKAHFKQNPLRHQGPSTPPKTARYNPVKHPVIADNSSLPASSLNHEK